MRLTIQHLFDLYHGGHFVTGNSYFLWPQVNEQEAPGMYERRLQRAAYPNFLFKIIEIYKGYVFWGSPKIEGESPLNLQKLGSDILESALVGGFTYVLTLAEGPQVYPAHIVTFNDDGTVEIKLDSHGENLILISPESVEQGEHGPVILKGTVKTIIKGTVTHEEPFTEGQLKKCKWDETGLSFIRDAAQLNLQIYNMQSVLDTLVLHAGIFITSGASIGDVKKVVPFMHIPTGQGEAPVEFKSPPVTQLKGVREEIDRRISILAAIVGLSAEFSEELKIETGEARKWKMLDTNAVVLQMAMRTAQSINFIEEVHAGLTGRTPATIQLEPLLNPAGDFDKLAKLDNIISTINIDEIVKAAQAEKVKIAFSDLPDAVIENLVDIVKLKGGTDSLNRTELLLNGGL